MWLQGIFSARSWAESTGFVSNRARNRCQLGMAGSQAEPWQDLSTERGFASPSPSPQPPVSLLLLQAQEPARGPVPEVRLCGSSCPQQAPAMLWVLVPGCWSLLKPQVSQFVLQSVHRQPPSPGFCGAALCWAAPWHCADVVFISFRIAPRAASVSSSRCYSTAWSWGLQPPGTERDLPVLPAAEASARLTPRSVFSAAFLQLLVSSLNFSVPFFHSFFGLSSQHLLAASLSVRSLLSCGHS